MWIICYEWLTFSDENIRGVKESFCLLIQWIPGRTIDTNQLHMGIPGRGILVCNMVCSCCVGGCARISNTWYQKMQVESARWEVRFLECRLSFFIYRTRTQNHVRWENYQITPVDTCPSVRLINLEALRFGPPTSTRSTYKIKKARLMIMNLWLAQESSPDINGFT